VNQITGELPTLIDLGIDQLYPDTNIDHSSSDQSKVVSDWTLDRGKYLKKTVRSILLNFLELIDILSEDPREAQFKVKHLQTLFLNAHHMLNEYRPHQARETLILMMEDEIAKKRAKIQAVKDMKLRMDSIASEVDGLPAVATYTNGVPNALGANASDSAVWDELDELKDLP
jgi:mediator of RNA polymerase II transcription subunit 7